MRRLLSALPAGTAMVGAGLGVLGVAAYAFLAIAGHTLSPRGYSDLAVLWMIVFSVGPGLFFPLEQELGRLVTARRSRGDGSGPVVRRVALIGLALLILLVATTLTTRQPLASWLFGGDARLVDALAVNLVALTAAHLSRGLLAGHGEFGRYGAQLALDGALRVGFAAALAWLGPDQAVWYGLALAAAPVLAVASTTPARLLRPDPGPPVRYADLVHGLGLLIVSSTLWLTVVNAGVVSARLLAAPQEVALAGALLSGLVLARVPLFVFSSLQASLLPALAAAAAAADREGFRRLLTRTGLVVAGLGAAGGVVCVLAGPWLVRVLFDTPAVLGRDDFAWLSAATAVFMLATVVGQACLALAGHRDQAIGWTVGFVVLLAVTLLPGPVLIRVEAAFMAGSLAAGLVLAAALRRRVRLWSVRPQVPAATPTPGLVE